MNESFRRIGKSIFFQSFSHIDFQVIFRQKRLEEIRNQISKAKYGDVRDISATDYVRGCHYAILFQLLMVD